MSSSDKTKLFTVLEVKEVKDTPPHDLTKFIGCCLNQQTLEIMMEWLQREGKEKQQQNNQNIVTQYSELLSTTLVSN